MNVSIRFPVEDTIILQFNTLTGFFFSKHIRIASPDDFLYIHIPDYR